MSLSKKLAPAAAALATFIVPAIAMAEGAATSDSNSKFGAYIGASIAIGLGALGGTLGQGRAAAAALEGIARNPGAAAKIQTPMILGLALIESLVLLSLVIAYLLQGK